ncbi:MAG: hemerythrin domain-containing protein [Bdellovibrionales bacterium]
MRVDLYTFIHKAQRFHLFRLSEQIGATDFSNTSEADQVAEHVLELMEHLKDHAQNEKTYIHPLFEAIGPIGAHLDKEHEGLEKEIEKVEQVIAAKHWANLYSSYSRFLGIYLLHLDEEEAAQRDVLWKHYEDKDLAVVFQRFKSERPAALAKADFEFMLPALSIPELIQMFKGIRASAPAPAFVGACDVASKILEIKKWQKIVNAIS